MSVYLTETFSETPPFKKIFLTSSTLSCHISSPQPTLFFFFQHDIYLFPHLLRTLFISLSWNKIWQGQFFCPVYSLLRTHHCAGMRKVLDKRMNKFIISQTANQAADRIRTCWVPREGCACCLPGSVRSFTTRDGNWTETSRVRAVVGRELQLAKISRS